MPAFRHLLLTTQCSVLVDGSEKPQLVRTLDDIEKNCADLNLERWHLDTIWDIFSSSSVKSYPHSESYSNIKDHTVIIIHSSGTTGLPKSVPVSHGYLATLDHMQTLPVPPGRETAQMFLRHRGQMRLLRGPLFHFLGLVCMAECIFYQTPFLLAPERPLTPNLFARIMATSQPPKWGLFAPFIFDGLRLSDQGRKALSCLSALNYGGASMSQATGDDLSSLFRLQTVMGSSETGYTPTLLCEDPSDWDCLEWNPAFEHRMEEVSDGLWELILPRPSSICYHGIFHSHPHLQEYRTGDLFEKHPWRTNLWRSKGRGDDIVVLSNGEKFNPIDAERLLETHPLIQRAFIIGQDHFQTALLVEPTWDELSSTWVPDSLIKDLKHVIDEANNILPSYANIHRTHIAFSSRDRPFPLTAKGSLRRREILQMYADVIDGLYQAVADTTTFTKKSETPQRPDFENIQQWVQDVVGEILSRTGIEPDDDIITLGMDSLQVVRLAQEFQDAGHAMKSSQFSEKYSWTSSTVYDKASIRLLAETLFQQVHSRDGGRSENPSSYSWPQGSHLTRATWQLVQGLENYGRSVVLTGSTGELGTYLLHEMLRDPSISQVYCLNRSPDAQARQLSQFRERQLADGWLTDTSRVQFWRVQLENELLGLTPDAYNLLRETADIVLHNAWTVNFNQPLNSFRPLLNGTRRLLQLCERSRRHAEFHFVSSIAVVSGRSNVIKQANSIPEMLHDASFVLQQGYAESKFVAESLCKIVAQKGRSVVAIHRVGQLAGPRRAKVGMWSLRDWLPALVQSSHTMGVFPDSLGSLPVDWVPIVGPLHCDAKCTGYFLICNSILGHSRSGHDRNNK